MRDVAKKSGVSITTVSHVLNETRPVAEETRERVLRAAAELNYFKNTSARLLVRGQSDLLGLIISDIENPFYPELIKSFERACTQDRLEMLLCATNYDRQQAENALRRMLENRVQGVAVMTSQFDQDLEKHLIDKRIPLVRLGSPPARQFRANIALDYRQGSREALQHLTELGHREVALLTGPRSQVSVREQTQAMVAEMKRLRLKPFRIVQGHDLPESGAQAVRDLLRASPRPTAILCGNDRMAIGALGAAAELGFRVPHDVSIVGADDVWMTRYCHPPLSTIRIPRDVLGQLAFDVLMKMLRSKRKLGSEHVLSTHLVRRGSTGEAPATDETIHHSEGQDLEWLTKAK
jgi:LacI family transcriptional regulator